LRRCARTRALVVLLSVAVCGAALNWGHEGGDDPGCAPALVQHDHAAHRFTPDRQPPVPQDQHCNLCHLLRLLHTAIPAESLLASNVSQFEARRAADSAPAIVTSNFDIPSRAPPAAAL
jgi:hypothetical protein